MPPINPTDPKDEIRHVVFEPQKPVSTRLKQYITIVPFEHDGKKYPPGVQVLLTEEVALPYLAGRFVTPMDVALRDGIYPERTHVAAEKVVDKIKHAVEEVVGIESSETPEPEKPVEDSKTLLGNKLRDMVQAQKAETAKIDAAKLAAIKAGGMK
jgi:hypothetical protein